MRPLIVLVVTALGVAPLAAQDTTSRDTTRRDSTRADSVPAVLLPVLQAPPPPPPPPPPAPPPPPTPEQMAYQDGLRTAGRGVAQLRDGIERVLRLRQSSDSVAQRRAARRLGGLCGSAQSFITSGRAKMRPTAYSDSLGMVARQVVVQLDALVKALPACEMDAGRRGVGVANDLTARLKAYEDALAAFRAAIAAQNRPDSTKT